MAEKLTDKEIIKSADNETVKQRVKAIYPHIVVSGDIDKPYYSIHWYDIEKEKMYCGFSSFKLELVRKWLEEEFEVVEADIDDLLNRQQAEITAITEKLNATIAGQETLVKHISNIETETIKEFAESLKKVFPYSFTIKLIIDTLANERLVLNENSRQN